MATVPAWEDAPAYVLSCPGPQRRHAASLVRVADIALPQCLLGCEAQLLAYAAATPALAGRIFFAPLPEIFSSPSSLDTALRACGHPGRSGGRIEHLRFGSTRMARVLKGARNAAVIAESHGPGPLTVSHHPFASGLVLPAAMRRVFVYGPETTRPRVLGGGVLPATELPLACMTADLDHAFAASEWLRPAELAGPGADAPGLDMVNFAEFRSGAWASRAVGGRPALRAALRGARGAAPFVLLPWNMDHPGSIVPELLIRLARLAQGRTLAVRPLVLPFNYLGQTGIIRRLIARVREASGAHEELVLAGMFLARLSRLTALKLLLRLSSVAWVDGNDPESRWTLARLIAAGISPTLLDGPDQTTPEAIRLAGDEPMWIEAETRYGELSFPVSLPSWRALPGLLDMTLARMIATKRRRAPARREAALTV